MDTPAPAFTAVYLKDTHGYTGFVEELPGVLSRGRTLEEARARLRHLTALAFDEERARSRELLAGKDVQREEFRIQVSPP